MSRLRDPPYRAGLVPRRGGPALSPAGPGRTFSDDGGLAFRLAKSLVMFVGRGGPGSMLPRGCGAAGPAPSRRLRLDTATARRARAKPAVTVLFTVVVGLLVSWGLGTATALADSSAVVAQSFESVSGLPAGWDFVEYTPGDSTVAIVKGAAANGRYFLGIVSSKPHHAGVVVPVQVSSNTSYQFHAMARASGANRNAAAVLGMEGHYTVTPLVRTDSRWQPLGLYVKIGPQTTIDLSRGLGYFGQLNVGTADFDAVTVTQVGAIPSGATVADLTTPPPAPAKPQTAAGSTLSQGPNEALWVFVGILAVVSIATAVFLLRHGNPKSSPEAAPKSSPESDTESPPESDTQPGRI